MGELSGRRDVRFPLDLEWPSERPQDSQGTCSCSGDSATRRTAGNASAPLRQSAELARSSPTQSAKPLALTSVVNRVILPALNRCERCRKARDEHAQSRITNTSGTHASRVARLARGTARPWEQSVPLGVPDMVIQRILRHANVSTTATYYIKTAADDVRNAMAKLENRISESDRAQQEITKTNKPMSLHQPSTTVQ